MTDSASPISDDPASAWHAAPEERSDRHDIRRLSLIRAAGRAFGRKGFHRTTLDEIASELSVTKPMLYRYVRSKQEILYECHRMAVSMAEDALDDAEARGGSPLEQIADFAEGYVARTTTALGTCVVLTEYYSMTPEDTDRIQERRRKLDTRLREVLRQAMAQDEIAPCDPKLAVFFFMGAINGVSRWFSEGGARDGHDIARVFSDHVVASLSPRKPWQR
ncbi:TetR/AcrR family transcriptional regulator [Pararhodobacter sp.]|jgi:TetR/AcrR family transcriptional regulator|uniref:TetR/AcrR family transcriptional regulator n=1 Tax=Pararhodobacter sp. TaxID=2127056 RepID=UPI002FDE9DE3